MGLLYCVFGLDGLVRNQHRPNPTATQNIVTAICGGTLMMDGMVPFDGSGEVGGITRKSPVWGSADTVFMICC